MFWHICTTWKTSPQSRQWIYQPESPVMPLSLPPSHLPHDTVQGLLILFLWLGFSPHFVKLINAIIQCISLLSGFFRSAYSYGDPSTLLPNCTQSYRGRIMTNEVSRHFCFHVCVGRRVYFMTEWVVIQCGLHSLSFIFPWVPKSTEISGYFAW